MVKGVTPFDLLYPLYHKTTKRKQPKPSPLYLFTEPLITMNQPVYILD